MFSPRATFLVALSLAASTIALTAHAATPTSGSAAMPSPEQRFQLGLEAQTARDYPTMLAELAAAADGGLVEAQELLGVLLLVGPALYGEAVRADACEAGRRLRAAVAAGSPIARWQSHLLNRARHAPGGCAD